MLSSLTSLRFILTKCKNWTTFFPVLPHSPPVRTQAPMCLYELKCSSFIAYRNAFSQVLIKYVSFQSKLSAWETRGRLCSCTCGSVSEQLPHSQKGFRSSGHHWDKNHTTGPKQGLVLRHMICATLTALNLSLHSGCYIVRV